MHLMHFSHTLSEPAMTLRTLKAAFMINILTASAAGYAALAPVDLDGDLSNGHEGVYDDVLDITWLADANLADSLDSYVAGINGDGSMNWDTAEAFVAELGANSYLGATNWRQPTASNCIGASCGDAPADTPNELGYHYFQNFGALSGSAVTDGANSANLGLFRNIQNTLYWTGYEGLGGATYFDTSSGTQSGFPKSAEFAVWVVADGNVGAPMSATVPVLPLAALGILFLLLCRIATTRQREPTHGSI